MTVYSQTEGLVYNTKNIDQPWDGTNQKAGTKCKEGSYVWVVKITNEKGQTEQYKADWYHAQIAAVAVSAVRRRQSDR